MNYYDEVEKFKTTSIIMNNDVVIMIINNDDIYVSIWRGE